MIYAEPKRCRYCQSQSVRWQPVEHSISHWPHVLVVRAAGWVCRACGHTSFDDDTLRFFEKMANKLRSGDIDSFTSLGGDYFSTSYRPATQQARPDRTGADTYHGGRRRVLPLIKPVIFRIRAPEAKRVWLVGKFAGDELRKYAMRRLVDGYWECSVQLQRGHYEYHFLVDDTPLADPRAIARVPDNQGGFNSVVEVG